MKTIVYYSYFTEVDVTVLKYLSKYYRIVWLPIHYNSGRDIYTQSDLYQYASEHNIEIHIVNIRWRRRSIKQFFMECKVLKLIKRVQPDLIFTTHRDLYFMLLSLFCLKRDKVLVGIHDYKLHSNFEKNVFLRFSYWLSYRLFNKFLFYSKGQRLLFLKDWPYKNSYQTYLAAKSYGVPTMTGTLSYEKIRFLFFGRIDYYKGLDLLINVLENLVVKGFKNFELSICGIGDYWEECKPLIKHESIYNLQIRFIENWEIPDLFATHHYLVLPYRDATQSGPSMIAVNYGLPILAPAFAAFTDVYPQESAIFYDAQESMEEAMIKALTMKEKEYQKLKECVMSIQDEFSEKSVSMLYKRAFDDILE